MSESKIIELDADLKSAVLKQLGQDATPVILNLTRAALAAYSQAQVASNVSKEEYLAFISECWDSGLRQREVNDGEAEGAIRTPGDVATSFACGIFLRPLHK